MRYLFLIVLQLCLGYLHAQYAPGYDSAARRHNTPYTEPNFENDKWSDGYIILGKGDTLYGKIKTGGDFYDAGDRQWQVEFRSDKKGQALYDPTQLRGYGYTMGNGYKAFHSMANTLPNIGGLFHDEERIFLEVVSIGKCSIYTYGQSSKRTQSPKAKKGGASAKPYCLIREGKDLLLVSPQNFLKVMMLYLSDCPSVVESIKAKKYTYQNWRDMVSAYNTACR